MDSKEFSEQFKVPKFSPATYTKIGLDDLVTVSLYFLRQTNKSPTFENLVAVAFGLFPECFAMVGYPDWPDSARINKSWLRCRSDKKLITGSVATGFTLTPNGERLAEKTLVKLKYTAPKSSVKKGDRRSIAGRVVSRVEKSSAYIKFAETNSVDNVTEYEMCDLLYGTSESSAETLSKNFETIIQNLSEHPRNDLIDFMKALRSKFIERFTSSRTKKGMLPHKV